MYKSVTLYCIMTKLHSISTKVIPIHAFVIAFAKSNPRIHILKFFNCAQAGVLKTVQKGLPLGLDAPDNFTKYFFSYEQPFQEKHRQLKN